MRSYSVPSLPLAGGRTVLLAPPYPGSHACMYIAPSMSRSVSPAAVGFCFYVLGVLLLGVFTVKAILFVGLYRGP